MEKYEDIKIESASIDTCNQAYRDVYGGLYNLDVCWSTPTIGYGHLQLTYYKDGHWDCDDEAMSAEFSQAVLAAYFLYVKNSQQKNKKTFEEQFELIDKYNARVKELQNNEQ